MKLFKKIFQVLFQINDFTDAYISGFFKDFGSIISSYMAQGMAFFEKSWKKTIITYNLFKTKFSLSTTIDINPQTMNLNTEGKKKLSVFIQEILRGIYDSIREDENMWSDYFGTADKKITT